MPRLPLLCLALTLAAIPAWAETQWMGSALPSAPQAEGEAVLRYEDCLRAAQVEPEQAYEMALQWRDMGGGDPARHCVAVALVALGRPGQAAQRLEALAQDMKADQTLKSRTLGQAAQAWMLAGNAKRAHVVVNTALKLTPDDPELLIDRSGVLAALGRYWDAVDDLNRVVDLAPGRAEAYVFRAAAYRHLESPDLARDDLERALKLQPHHPEALLERGILRRQAGDKDGARKDWLAVLLRYPDTPAADAARDHLEKMDVKTGGVAKPPRRTK